MWINPFCDLSSDEFTKFGGFLPDLGKDYKMESVDEIKVGN